MVHVLLEHRPGTNWIVWQNRGKYVDNLRYMIMFTFDLELCLDGRTRVTLAVV